MHHTLRFAAVLAVSAVLASGAAAQKSTSSDAEIESSVIKAMAGDNRLVNQQIQTSTAFGVVTLSGSVPDEATRVAAEQVVAHTAGVKKVVDQITIGSDAAATPAKPVTGANGTEQPTAEEQAGMDAINEANGAPGQQAPADAPVPAPQNAPLATYPLPSSGQQVGQAYPQTPQGYPQGKYPPPPQGYPQQNYPPQQGYPQSNYPQQGYPPQQAPYVTNNSYPQQPAPGMYRRDYERQQGYANQQQPYGYPNQGGQPGGQHITIAAGVVLPVRITRWLSSGDAEPGSTFSAVVENDVLAGGYVAIPRGAEVQGTVVDAKGAGALKGRGSLTLQLNTLRLGGQIFPLQSQPFTVTGHDKAAQSVNSALGGAAIGAVIGAIAGRGTGAAIGAGVGGVAGLGASAASGGGNAHIPAEALLHFQLTAPVDLLTVSEAEMQRLGNFAGPEGSRRPLPPSRGPYYGYGYPGPYPYYGRPYPGYYGGYYGW